MKVAFTSDLHIEFNRDFRLENDDGADVLLLAGDILLAEHMHRDFYQEFLADTAKKFGTVLAVSGNHEYYRGYINKSNKTLKEEYAKHGINYLFNETFEVGDQVFFGGTLWTDVNKGCPLTADSLTFGMNDYAVITFDSKDLYRKLRPMDTKKLHHETIEALRKVCALNRVRGKNVFVMTHHGPCAQSTPPRYKNDYYMNGGYVSDLVTFTEEMGNISHWVHGHMHDPVDYDMVGTRVISNPLGYPGETYGPGYPFKLKTIEL